MPTPRVRSSRFVVALGAATAAFLGASVLPAAPAPARPATAVAIASSAGGPGLRGARGPSAPLTAAGRWTVDRYGRVVVLHGVNRVAKAAPYTPEAFGFGPDDLEFLADQGLNVVRLGVDFRGLMPTPGVVDHAYLDALERTVDAAAAERIFVLLDFHQDGFGPLVHGNGFPEWMTITDGLDNPPVPFPLYYIGNPALQRAFENFWSNRLGPDGVGIQDSFLRGFGAVVRRFGADRWVAGYELMNEPWPGADWASCADATGCPELEAERLVPFARRAERIVRRHSPRQLLAVEPFVLFNFGQGPTTMPGLAPGRALLATHSYALSVAGEEAVVRFTNEAADTQSVPPIITEFGASTSATLADRLADQFDAGRLSWIFWEYAESVIGNEHEPAGLDNLAGPGAFAALARPYPLAIAGTPIGWAFDDEHAVFELVYDRVLPRGSLADPALATVISVPRLHYPQGYRVVTIGARVVSAPCSERLVVQPRRGARYLAVHVEPATDPAACGPIGG